jgi:hypothetical protein
MPGLWNDLPAPVEGSCLMCGKEREVIDVNVRRTVDIGIGICDACSYALREAWNDFKRLRIPALDSNIATTYVVIPRLIPSRSELDISGYEFVVAGGGWPSTSFLSRQDLVKWLRDTFKVITWPGRILRIYAGFDEHARFAEVVLLTIWGSDYAKTKEVDLKWSSFDALLTPATVKGAFMIGAKAGFEGFLLQRELAPSATRECIVLGEPAVRYLTVKRGLDKDPVWSSGKMLDAYFEAMPEKERLVVGQLLSSESIESSPPSKTAPVAVKTVVVPARPTTSAVQQDLGFDKPGDQSAGIEAEFEETEEEASSTQITGPLEPKP